MSKVAEGRDSGGQLQKKIYESLLLVRALGNKAGSLPLEYTENRRSAAVCENVSPSR